MSRVPADVIEAMRGSHLLGVFLRLDLQPEPLRVWLGVNDIPAGISSVDPTTSERYIGGGLLREVPSLEAVINGVAERADFMISGIDPRSLARFDIDAVDVRGRDFHVGVTTLDDHYQPMSAIIPLITGRASYLFERMPPVNGDENPTVTVGLSVGFGITTRDRNSSVLWSSVHQEALWKKFFPTPAEQAAHPRDRLCDNTARLERGAAPSWPRF